MSTKRRVLVQLDSDPHASVFDAVVAIDAGVECLLSYGNVKVEQVPAMVHGAIFTRGVEDLKNTAIFVGGSDVGQGEAMLRKVKDSFIGPMRVSVMLDASGANTTAAAAVLAARKHLDLEGARALVLAGTGPVGQRVVRLLAREGCEVRVASRQIERSQEAAAGIGATVPGARLVPVATTDEVSLRSVLEGVQLVVAAGAAGVRLLPAAVRQSSRTLKVAIDLNAVPPLGIEGVDMLDKGKEREGVITYGAIGVGGAKMKIHRAAVASLFQANDRVLNAEQIYDLGKTL